MSENSAGAEIPIDRANVEQRNEGVNHQGSGNRFLGPPAGIQGRFTLFMHSYITAYLNGEPGLVEDVVRSFGFLTLGSRMKRIGEKLQADTQKIMDELGAPLQASQYPFLAAIDRHGPLTVGELAEAVGITQPGATRTVGQLVELGMLETAPAPGDQRRRIVTLTKEGKRLVAAAKRDVWPRISEAVADLCGSLDGPLLDQLAAIEDGLAAAPLDRRAARVTA